MRRTSHERAAVGMIITDNGLDVLGKRGETIRSGIVIPKINSDTLPKVSQRVAPPVDQGAVEMVPPKRIPIANGDSVVT
jgi:hypothetical protein